MNNIRYISFIRANLLLIIAVLALFGTSCKTQRKLPQSPLTLKTPQELNQLAEDHTFKFEWLNAKLSANVTTAEKSTSVTVTLRMRKDSAIWMSISPALGIEAARVLITKDSLKLMDRINSKYAVSNFSYLNDLLQIFVDIDMVQSLLLGNNFSYLDDKKIKSSFIDENLYVISTSGRRKLRKSIVDDKEISRKIGQDIWLDPNQYRVNKMLIEDKKANKKLLSKYSDFRDVEGQQFPFAASFDVQGNKQVQITIEFSKVSINKPQEFPFTIPEKYEKM